MMGRFPLWVVLVVWYFQRQHRQSVPYAEQKTFLKAMMSRMGVPQGKVEKWLFEKAMHWLKEEEQALAVLTLLKVLSTEVVNELGRKLDDQST